jgi:N-acetyl-gamma-glutamyl-phosphate reductase
MLPETPSAQKPQDAAKRRAALLGSKGYAGQEFLRLARGHERIEIAALGVREGDALPTAPSRAKTTGPAECPLGALEELLLGGGCDLVVSCLPHGVWQDIASRHPGLAAAPQIIDLSSDFRDGAAGYVYGLPEAGRAEIRDARRVANPGCYATAASLALLPAAEAQWLAGPVSVSALSGVSGAGRSVALRTSFVETEGGAWAYRAGVEHAHVAEIERTLARAGASAPLGFVPQVVPMARGILLTAFAPLGRALSAEEARAHYAARYGEEPFVRLLPPGEWPETRAVRQSNRCDLSVTTLHGGRTLLVVAALDNLGKGAAGQAIQNLNLMNGWPETMGLPLEGTAW